jgi:hypothetical protein
MAFVARQPGVTLRRQAFSALHLPGHPAERFDGDYPVVMRCELCGKFAHGPRGLISEAMREHRESACPKRHTKADEPNMARIFYPRTT